MKIQHLTRQFTYGAIQLQDPGPGMSLEEVKAFYATLYPELTNAEIEGPENVDDKQVYEFRKAVGTKGNDAPTAEDLWAIVELFGHQRIAGKLSEQTLGGCHFIRIDVPETDRQKPFTKLYTQGAIYGVTFVEERIARAAAAHYEVAPVSRYELTNLLPSPGRDDDGEF